MTIHQTIENALPATCIGVSTKMYLGYGASLRWLEQIQGVVADRPGIYPGGPVRVVVIPSYPVLESARRIFVDGPVLLGAQNCSWGEGALTGEVSAAMLSELGVSVVEIGHAERRSLFGESDAVVALKTKAALAAGLEPLLCVGEDVRMAPEDAAGHCLAQVMSAIGSGGRQEKHLGRLLLAYEPVWAIGAPAPAPAEYVNCVADTLRRMLAERSEEIPGIIYGGSAGPGLLPELESLDGLFLGRFAHDPENFGIVLDEALGGQRPAAGAR
ncbi:triose-phosphate isomerase family protein [Arthrobacter sp. H14-L1]|uniref:triose-phosphate isomerase family protein n=1 Tax=Arthrobacter sp. H14-L1 TaxID=2996697 RepID=UPI00226E6FD7|nr:triose-phosphate isomerase family protein [Arthrobacter sp. H14-L1]MCY0905157.1 triose-phosphate isomerase [Arthrobacter sp. H14-L1]